MADTLAWLSGSFWNRVLLCAIIIEAGAIAASLAWIVVFALMALRDWFKSFDNHNNVAKRRKR